MRGLAGRFCVAAGLISRKSPSVFLSYCTLPKSVLRIPPWPINRQRNLRMWIADKFWGFRAWTHQPLFMHIILIHASSAKFVAVHPVSQSKAFLQVTLYSPENSLFPLWVTSVASCLAHWHLPNMWIIKFDLLTCPMQSSWACWEPWLHVPWLICRILQALGSPVGEKRWY